ncbi:MAG TPA: anti-sigma regulatory factor [Gammaproteobacteria bacterium]
MTNIVSHEPQQHGVRILVESDTDLVSARHAGRALAEHMGFSSSESTLIATAISELARNIIEYANYGEIHLDLVRNATSNGIRIVAKDSGPGISNVEQALRGGYSTSGGLGLGLAGVRHIMDQFDLESNAGTGTCITVTKWKL